jgi:hypothetical protein
MKIAFAEDVHSDEHLISEVFTQCMNEQPKLKDVWATLWHRLLVELATIEANPDPILWYQHIAIRGDDTPFPRPGTLRAPAMSGRKPVPVAPVSISASTTSMACALSAAADGRTATGRSRRCPECLQRTSAIRESAEIDRRWIDQLYGINSITKLLALLFRGIGAVEESDNVTAPEKRITPKFSGQIFRHVTLEIVVVPVDLIGERAKVHFSSPARHVDGIARFIAAAKALAVRGVANPTS